MVNGKTITVIFVAAFFSVASSFEVFASYPMCPGHAVVNNIRSNESSHSYYRIGMTFRITAPNGYLIKRVFNNTTRSFSFFGLRRGFLKYIKRCPNGHIIVKQPCHLLLNNNQTRKVSIGVTGNNTLVTIKEGEDRFEYHMSDFFCNVTAINTGIGDDEDYDLMYRDLMIDRYLPRSSGCMDSVFTSLPYWMRPEPIPEGETFTYKDRVDLL